MAQSRVWLLSVLCLVLGLGGGAAAADEPPKDDPKAHALYDQMVKTLRDAKTLSFESECRLEARGQEVYRATYHAWLKKPNQFRVEAFRPRVALPGPLGTASQLWLTYQTWLERLGRSSDEAFRPESDKPSTLAAVYRAWRETRAGHKQPSEPGARESQAAGVRPTGVLVGDGENLWIHWPGGKPQFQWEFSGKYGERYKKYKDVFYMKKPTPKGMHSIAHETCYLGIGMTILDLSMFHGYTDCMQQYIDSVRYVGEEDVGGEPCDQIEVSMMKHQRSWYLWLARKDHLPRKLKQVVRVSYDLVMYEFWSNIAIDKEIADERFVWTPPEGWRQWRMPRTEEGLPKPGDAAPDFELASLDGDENIRLSSFRGNFVWLYKWRCG